jgi:hypothetical protein
MFSVLFQVQAPSFSAAVGEGDASSKNSFGMQNANIFIGI